MIALDASALLAMMFRERGHERVAETLGDCIMSTVNLSEVLGKFARDGHPVPPVLTKLQQTPIRWVAFDQAQGAIAAGLVPHARPLGLSLGDRACLALATIHKIPALTADAAWRRLSVGIEIEVIR